MFRSSMSRITSRRRRLPPGRNAGFMKVMLEGRYTDAYLAEAGGDSPKFTDDELKTIASPLDFVGINVYKPGWYVEPSAEPPGYRDIPINAPQPKKQSWWHVLDPEVMYWAPRQMQSIWGARSPPERRALIWRQSTRSRASRGRTCWHAHRDGREARALVCRDPRCCAAGNAVTLSGPRMPFGPSVYFSGGTPKCATVSKSPSATPTFSSNVIIPSRESARCPGNPAESPLLADFVTASGHPASRCVRGERLRF